MRASACSALVLAAALVVCANAASPSEDAQRAHAKGTCGSLGPGTGLRGGKGWIVSMLPGRHEVRMRGGGQAFLTVSRQTTMDFDSGRPYYIVIEDAPANAVLEWKTPFSAWARVPDVFLYPPQGAARPLSNIASKG